MIVAQLLRFFISLARYTNKVDHNKSSIYIINALKLKIKLPICESYISTVFAFFFCMIYFSRLSNSCSSFNAHISVILCCLSHLCSIGLRRLYKSFDIHSSYGRILLYIFKRSLQKIYTAKTCFSAYISNTSAFIIGITAT